MKKLFIFSALLFLMSFSIRSVYGGDYLTYQDIEFEHNGGKLLSQFSSSDFSKYYKKLGKRRFYGWKTFIAYKEEPVSYVRDTLYVIINEGESAITETIKFSRDSVKTKQFGVSGSIALDTKKSTKGFKLGLESKINYSASVSEKTTLSEEYQIRVSIDPMTKLEIKVLGEGKVTNGVGKFYRFWVEAKKGGWEIFLVTTEYYSIVKVKIDES